MTEQGDIRRLDNPVAMRLLASTEYARIAYVAPDGTPRLPRAAGVSMARVVLRPSCVGVLDFQSQFPPAMVEAFG